MYLYLSIYLSINMCLSHSLSLFQLLMTYINLQVESLIFYTLTNIYQIKYRSTAYFFLLKILNNCMHYKVIKNIYIDVKNAAFFAYIYMNV